MNYVQKMMKAEKKEKKMAERAEMKERFKKIDSLIKQADKLLGKA